MGECRLLLCSVQSLTIDNGRLKVKEKKLVKESIKLNRNVRVITHELYEVARHNCCVMT